jgi:serine/threonine-protein kinase
VGGYIIREWLGEGGFAEVYSAAPRGRAATGDDPQRVALRIIKRGMGSHEIVSQFRAEHRTIPLLSHPRIVKPLETGVTGDGLPYLAMAQSDGLPITDYCKPASSRCMNACSYF